MKNIVPGLFVFVASLLSFVLRARSWRHRPD
jgi:hypothetical protein